MGKFHYKSKILSKKAEKIVFLSKTWDLIQTDDQRVYLYCKIWTLQVHINYN